MIIEKVFTDIGLTEKCRNWVIKRNMVIQKVVRGCQISITFLLVNCFWVLFRSSSIEQAGYFFKRLLSGGEMTVLPAITEKVNKLVEVRIAGRFGLNSIMAVYPAVPCFFILVILLFGVFFMSNTQEKMQMKKYNWKRSLITVGILVWCVISLSSISEFLYFNF